MTENALYDIFIELLRSELNETELDNDITKELVPNVISALYFLSKRQDLAHIISSSLRKFEHIDQQLLTNFQNEEFMSVYRHEQIKYAYNEICGILNAAEIPYIPLKGSIIRPFYPQEIMRTSCDVDILVKQEHLDVAIDGLVRAGYKMDKKTYHEVSLFSQNNTHLELHFSIQENMPNLDKILKNAWEYATPKQRFCYGFSDEFFLFHIFAHMSYHFMTGGCGIRSLMDIWVIEHKMGITYKQSKMLLEEAGIYKFAEALSHLANSCFSGKPLDDLSKKLLQYIFNGGVYGTSKNGITVAKAKNQSTFVYALNRIFLPYRTMVVPYPILKKLPILLPFFWIIRIFEKLMNRKISTGMGELQTANNISKEDINTIKEIREKLEI